MENKKEKEEEELTVKNMTKEEKQLLVVNCPLCSKPMYNMTDKIPLMARGIIKIQLTCNCERVILQICGKE